MIRSVGQSAILTYDMRCSGTVHGHGPSKNVKKKMKMKMKKKEKIYDLNLLTLPVYACSCIF